MADFETLSQGTVEGGRADYLNKKLRKKAPSGSENGKNNPPGRVHNPLGGSEIQDKSFNRQKLSKVTRPDGWAFCGEESGGGSRNPK